MVNPQYRALGENRSCIRELFEYGCRQAQTAGAENVFDYSLGNPAVPTPQAVTEALLALVSQEDPAALHGYTAACGGIAARQAIADDLNARFCAGASPDDLFLTCGAAPALTAVFRALSAPGAEILAIAPYFPEYRPFAENAGLVFRVVPPDVPGFQIDLDALDAMLTPQTAAVILNSPNNPSGVVYTEETLRALGELLLRRGAEFGHPVYIVSDEPYRELTYGCAAPFLPNIYPHTVVCYSYSKSLSLPGERIGYVYVPRTAADHAALYAAVAGAARAGGHVCAPSLWQAVIARCASLRPDLDAYGRKRTLLYDGLRAAGYETAKPDGAFYLFVKAPGGDAAAFSERAKRENLLVVPGGGFGCPGYFRVCYCVSEDTIRRSLPVFAALRREYPG